MFGRKRLKMSVLSESKLSAHVLSLCFYLGSLIGCLTSRYMVDSEPLRHYVQRYVSCAVEGIVSYHLVPMICDTVCIPLLVVLLGVTILGPFGIPCLFFYRGFCFCLSVSAFVSCFGLAGLLFSFVLLGISALIWAPPFLLLGCKGWRCAHLIAARSFGEQRGQTRPERAFLVESLFCLLMIVLSAFVEFWMISLLLPVVGKAL